MEDFMEDFMEDMERREHSEFMEDFECSEYLEYRAYMENIERTEGIVRPKPVRAYGGLLKIMDGEFPTLTMIDEMKECCKDEIMIQHDVQTGQLLIRIHRENKRYNSETYLQYSINPSPKPVPYRFDAFRQCGNIVKKTFVRCFEDIVGLFKKFIQTTTKVIRGHVK